MKSELKITEKKVNLPYPCLKRYLKKDEDDSLVVLFTSPGEGFVVCGHLHPLGSQSHQWAEDVFELFEGTVELSN